MTIKLFELCMIFAMKIETTERTGKNERVMSAKLSLGT
jgi:hypothetical protein